MLNVNGLIQNLNLIPSDYLKIAIVFMTGVY